MRLLKPYRFVVVFVCLGIPLQFMTSGNGAFAAPLLQESAKEKQDDKETVAEDEEPEQSAAAKALAESRAAFDKAMQGFMKEYREAQKEEKTAEEIRKLVDEKLPSAGDEKFGFMKLAKEFPNEPEAFDALVFLVQRDRKSTAAMDMLVEKHIDNPKLAPICSRMVYSEPRQKTMDSLTRLAEKSTVREVQGSAWMAIADYHGQINSFKSIDKKQLEGAFSEESIEFINSFEFDEAKVAKIYQRVMDDFGDVSNGRGGTLKDQAGSALFEMENLSIGKVAPDIEGKDLDGVEFKLSDYRGKVVVIDFWVIGEDLAGLCTHMSGRS